MLHLLVGKHERRGHALGQQPSERRPHPRTPAQGQEQVRLGVRVEARDNGCRHRQQIGGVDDQAGIDHRRHLNDRRRARLLLPLCVLLVVLAVLAVLAILAVEAPAFVLGDAPEDDPQSHPGAPLRVGPGVSQPPGEVLRVGHVSAGEQLSSRDRGRSRGANQMIGHRVPQRPHRKPGRHDPSRGAAAHGQAVGGGRKRCGDLLEQPVVVGVERPGPPGIPPVGSHGREEPSPGQQAKTGHHGAAPRDDRRARPPGFLQIRQPHQRVRHGDVVGRHLPTPERAAPGTHDLDRPAEVPAIGRIGHPGNGWRVPRAAGVPRRSQRARYVGRNVDGESPVTRRAAGQEEQVDRRGADERWPWPLEADVGSDVPRGQYLHAARESIEALYWLRAPTPWARCIPSRIPIRYAR